MHSSIQSVIANGVSPDLIYFLLIMPLMVMVATFARHVLGLKIMGMYVVISMTYILGFLIENNTLLSVAIGSGVLLFVYMFSYYIKRLTVHLGLHYFSRISLVITMISILLVSFLMILGSFPEFVSEAKLEIMNPFALITVVFLSEHFSSNQSQKGIKTSRVLFFNSLLLALATGVLVSIDDVRKLFLDYPYLTLLFLALTFFFGKYKGMRVSEMFRFKSITVEDKND